MAQFLQAQNSLKEKNLKRWHMNHLRELIRRLRAGESERRIALDMSISWPAVHKYREFAKQTVNDN